jgi:predicted Zn finger-like uncharacterized protein
MRLVCPNCEAKYEVPEDAIPESGRDVQCANCGHAWFQMRSRVGAADAEAVPASAPVAEPDMTPVADATPGQEAILATPVEAPQGKAEPVEAVAAPASALAGNVGRFTGPQSAEAAAAPVAKAAPKPENAPAPAPYAVDESVLAILREEAEREAEARRAEARPLETQPDLGLDAAMPARQKPALVASGGALLHGPDDAETRPSARRTLLPDVEEINSTLRPSEVPVDADDGQIPLNQREGRGFRSGFLMVMAVAIVGAGVYLAAPQLSTMFPALAGALEIYVGAIDSLRLSLDGLMRSATVAINGA